MEMKEGKDAQTGKEACTPQELPSLSPFCCQVKLRERELVILLLVVGYQHFRAPLSPLTLSSGFAGWPNPALPSTQSRILVEMKTKDYS